MTAKHLGLAMLAAALVVECLAQLCMKLAVGGGRPPGARNSSPDPVAVARRSTATCWIIVSALLWLIEIFFYTQALHGLDVSVAFPIGSISFVGVALLSRFFLGEKVGWVRSLGVCCIVAGTLCLAL